jgi:hypothetical protein
MSEWLTFSSKRKGKGKKVASASAPGADGHISYEAEAEVAPVDVGEVLARLEVLKGHIGQTELYKDLLKALAERRTQGHSNKAAATSRIVAFGIGRFASSNIALLQLALLLCLLRDEVRNGNVESTETSYIFDPMCDVNEEEICSKLGLETLKENIHGKFDATSTMDGATTLFYMPHCPYSLYGNVLWRNWDHLEDITIIGNSFNSYALRRDPKVQVSTGSAPGPDCVNLLTPILTEIEIWESSHNDPRVCPHASRLQVMESAFNDMSVMFYKGCASEAKEEKKDSSGSRLLHSIARPAEEELDAWNRANDLECY